MQVSAGRLTDDYPHPIKRTDMIATEPAILPVLDRPVRIEGGTPVTANVGSYSGGANYTSDGGYTVYRFGTRVSLGKWNSGATVSHIFLIREQCDAEYARISALLNLRQTILDLRDLEAVPTEFLPAIELGDLFTLAVAADWCDDRGESSRAHYLRALYHRVAGESIAVIQKIGNSFVYLNPPRRANERHHDTSRKVKDAKVVILTPGESVTIIGENGQVNEFKMGDRAQYGGWNLDYYGAIVKITAKYGAIVKITAKTVTVNHDVMNLNTSVMTPERFLCWNENFSLAASKKRNAEWMD